MREFFRRLAKPNVIAAGVTLSELKLEFERLRSEAAIWQLRERVKLQSDKLKIRPENPGITVSGTMPWEADNARTQAPGS